MPSHVLDILDHNLNPMTSWHIQGVLFDLDGVITDTRGLHVAAWQAVFDEYLLALRKREPSKLYTPFDAENDYSTLIDGRPRLNGIRRFLDSRQIPEAETEINEIASRKNQYYLKLLAKYGVNVDPLAKRFLQEARSRGLKTAVVSSSKNCLAVLRKAGIEETIDLCVDGAMADNLNLRGKPQPDMFLEAARRLNLPPSTAAAVEDALVGIEAARAAGLCPVIAFNKHQDFRLNSTAADALIESFNQLVIIS